MHRIGVIGTVELAQVPRSGWDREIARVAGSQHGIVTHAQLIAIGMRSSTIRARVATGRLYRVQRGVYAVGYPPLLEPATGVPESASIAPRRCARRT